MMKSLLPRRIIRHRELQKLTQERLAERSGVSVSRLNELESGLSTDVKLSTIQRICFALEITPGILFADALIPGNCPVCNRRFPDGHLHTLSECITLVHEDGRPLAWIAGRVGLSASSIEEVLRDEYEVRRLRR